MLSAGSVAQSPSWRSPPDCTIKPEAPFANAQAWAVYPALSNAELPALVTRELNPSGGRMQTRMTERARQKRVHLRDQAQRAQAARMTRPSDD